MDQSTQEQTNNKATPTKPKRPLTALNLFYRFKSQAILKASSSDSSNSFDNDDEAAYAQGIIDTMPGLEFEWYTPLEYSDLQYMTDEQVKATRRATIQNVMQANLTSAAKKKKRSNKKTQGALSFVEMNKLMCAAWKATDAYAKGVFNELAEEGRALHRVKMEEWKEANPEEANKKTVTKKKSAKRKSSSDESSDADLNEQPKKRTSSPVQTSYYDQSTAAPVSPNGSIEAAIMNFDPFDAPAVPQFERQDSGYSYRRSISMEYAAATCSTPAKKRDVSALAMETASLMMDESGLGILEFMLNTSSSSAQEEPAAAPQSPSASSSSKVSIDDVMQLLMAKKSSAASSSSSASENDGDDPSNEDFMTLLNGDSDENRAADEIVAAMVSPELTKNEMLMMNQAVHSPPPPPFESEANYEQDCDLMFGGNFHEVETPKKVKKPKPSTGDYMDLFGQMDLFQ